MDENTQPAQSPENSAKKGSGGAIKIIGAVVVIAVLAFLVWEFGLKGSSEENANQNMTVQPTNPPEATSIPTVGSYKDGTYEAIGEYTNPASREELNVTVTLKDGVITAASFTGTPDNATTTRMQTNFRNGFEEVVVGKSLDEVALTVVNGSSLTPKGFMDALNKVKAEAKS
jgi:uncharacterized protein with FMN-binding domain